VEDAVQRFAGFAASSDQKQLGRQINPADVRAPLRGRVTSGSRRVSRQRAMLAGERDLVLAEAVRRLEREHVALLIALCELEDASEPLAMRQALRLLLREDLRCAQHALSLAAEGRYGACEDCARPLPRRALELKPATTRCPLCSIRFQ
jgi:DnaK suppressor protein